jgi:hypothetical protein
VIEQQNQRLMELWGISFVNLDTVKVEELAEYIARNKPSILLATVETLDKKEVRDALLTVRITYVSLDEAQVDKLRMTMRRFIVTLRSLTLRTAGPSSASSARSSGATSPPPTSAPTSGPRPPAARSASTGSARPSPSGGRM